MKFSKVKVSKRYGGGGGTSSSVNVPPELMPYLVNVNQNAESLHGAGELSKVAGATGNQQLAFGAGGQAIGRSGGQGLDLLQGQQGRLNNMAMAPSAETLAAQKANVLYEAQKGVSGLNTQFGQNGTLGSARQAVLQGAQNAETTGRIAQVDADYENKMFQNRLAAEQALGGSVAGSSNLANATASGLANLGQQERGVDQSALDKNWQGLQRYASTVYGNPARQQVTQGGGK